MSAEEFASAAEKEFSGMMSTLRNSDVQMQAKYSVFGTGGKVSASNQKSSGSRKDKTRNAQSSSQKGTQSSAR